jgi:type IV pilus assembly protein PilC
MDAKDRLSLAKMLRDKGDMLIKATEKKKGIEINLPFLNKVKNEDIILFCRNLGGLMQAGVPLARSIEILGKQTQNKKFKEVLNKILEDIRSGSSLSQALAKHPEVFENLFIAMMRAGEESGNLVGTLKEVQIHLERAYNLKKKIKGAMMYPTVILAAMGLIGLLMFKFVVPTLLKVFTDFDVELPLPTKIVLWLSNTINGNFFTLIIGIGVIVGFFLYIRRFEKFKTIMSKLVLRLPMIKNIAKETLTARTSRTLASLLTSGVSVGRSLEIAKDVVGNKEYQKVIEEAKNNVEKGVPLSKAFKDNVNLFPIMMGDMMEVGEESGKVGQMLLDVAAFYEDEVDQKTKNLSTIIEPLLMLFIGGGVGFFAVAMMKPMYSMMDNVK